MSAGSESPGRAATGRPPSVLELAGVGKRYGDRVALAAVDLRVAPGETVVLIGPNGSGKTTLLLVACGLCRPDTGTAVVAGSLAGSGAARAVTALVPDEPAGFDELTVAEHLRLMAVLAGAPPGAGLAAADLFALDGLAALRLGELSRGQRRRVAVAAALAGAPRLLLVDEATATLDRPTVDVLALALRRHAAAGGAAVVATHDRAFARHVGDRVVFLSGGAVVGAGPPDGVDVLAALRAGGDGTGRRSVLPAGRDVGVAAR